MALALPSMCFDPVAEFIQADNGGSGRELLRDELNEDHVMEELIS